MPALRSLWKVWSERGAAGFAETSGQSEAYVAGVGRGQQPQGPGATSWAARVPGGVRWGFGKPCGRSCKLSLMWGKAATQCPVGVLQLSRAGPANSGSNSSSETELVPAPPGGSWEMEEPAEGSRMGAARPQPSLSLLRA